MRFGKKKWERSLPIAATLIFASSQVVKMGFSTATWQCLLTNFVGMDRAFEGVLVMLSKGLNASSTDRY